jgi:ubiquitin-conjugating enzyme E2 G2
LTSFSKFVVKIFDPISPQQQVIQQEMSGKLAIKRLMSEYKELTVNPPEGLHAGPIDESNYFEWEALITGPSDTPFEDGIFCANLSFPKDYPLSPPKMKFTTKIYHPNVYEDGTVCISILHPPGKDPNGYEDASERWSPVQSVEKILLSVVSMLAEPNVESPASVDAAKMYRTDRARFNQIVRDCVRLSLGL